ncbi:MAG: hypothetical protein U0521_15790 [Anaerolineae bacterium]
MTIAGARGVIAHQSAARLAKSPSPGCCTTGATDFRQPVHDGLALTAVYVMLMAIFLQPLLRRERARLASEV